MIIVKLQLDFFRNLEETLKQLIFPLVCNLIFSIYHNWKGQNTKKIMKTKQRVTISVKYID